MGEDAGAEEPELLVVGDDKEAVVLEMLATLLSPVAAPLLIPATKPSDADVNEMLSGEYPTLR